MIDIRSVKCACNNDECIMGVSFDSNPDVMRFHDKNGKEHTIFLDKKAAREMIIYLKQIK